MSKFHMLLYLLPLCMLLLTGYFSRLTGYFSENNTKDLGVFFLKFAVPAVLFLSMVKLPIELLLTHGKFSMAFALSVLIPYALSIGVLRLFGMSYDNAKYFAVTGSFPNIVAVGLPVILSVPHSNEMLQPFTIALAIEIIMVIVFITRPYEHLQGKLIHRVGTVIIQSMKSPLVIAVLLGALGSAIHLSVPHVFYKTLHPIAKSVAAIGLICLGLELHMRLLFKKNWVIWMMVVIKMIITPLIAYALTVFFDLTQAQQFVCVLLSACPTIAVGVMIIQNKTDLGQDATAAMAGSIILCFVSLAVVSYFLAF